MSQELKAEFFALPGQLESQHFEQKKLRRCVNLLRYCEWKAKWFANKEISNAAVQVKLGKSKNRPNYNCNCEDYYLFPSNPVSKEPFMPFVNITTRIIVFCHYGQQLKIITSLLKCSQIE